MKTIKRNVLRGFLITLVVLLSILAKDSVAQEEEILTGLVKAVNWKKSGEVTAAVLVVISNEEDDKGNITTYKEKYLIEDDITGRELFETIGETVEVKGEIHEFEDGAISLKVISYVLIESEEENYEQHESPESENF